MLTRDQMLTLLEQHKQRPLHQKKITPNFFSNLPIEVVLAICDANDEDPNSDIGKALHHAAYARKEDVDALLAMLDANPRLLLEAGNVITPGGDEVRRVTPYEFLLGAGDYELAEIVQGYFSKIEKGEQERVRQYERYRLPTPLT